MPSLRESVRYAGYGEGFWGWHGLFSGDGHRRGSRLPRGWGPEASVWAGYRRGNGRLAHRGSSALEHVCKHPPGVHSTFRLQQCRQLSPVGAGYPGHAIAAANHSTPAVSAHVGLAPRVSSRSHCSLSCWRLQALRACSTCRRPRGCHDFRDDLGVLPSPRLRLEILARVGRGIFTNLSHRVWVLLAPADPVSPI